MGQLRSFIRSTFPSSFRTIVGGAVAIVLVGAFAAALTRIRQDRLLRFGLLFAAAAIGSAYARLTASGNPDQDLVERVHFVEYGVLTLLFYRAWRTLDDASVLVLPMAAGLVVATLDEGLQWFVPSRVGEMRDVALDGVAIGCGLLFCLALSPPTRAVFSCGHRSLARIYAWSGLAVLAFALFFGTIHLGYEVRDGEGATFRSRYSSDELKALARDRAERWRRTPPGPQPLFSREDQYLTEAAWHLQRRNLAWSEGDIAGSWRENRILEEFFDPFLDTAASAPLRWPGEQRLDAERRAGTLRPFVSQAIPYPIYTWSRPLFWTGTAMVIGLLLISAAACSRRAAKA